MKKNAHKFQKTCLWAAGLMLAAGPAFFLAARSSAAETQTAIGIPEETALSVQARFLPMAQFEPELWPIPQGGQSCVARRVSESDASELIVECEFTAEHQPEYLSVGTPFFVRTPGFMLGVRLCVEEKDPQTGAFLMAEYPVNVRFLDPSGEWHQTRCATRFEDWYLGSVESCDPFWGGDGDGVLQFPCAVEALVVDHPAPSKPRTCRVTIQEVRLFKKETLPKVLTLREKSVSETSPSVLRTAHVFPEGQVPPSVSFQMEFEPEFQSSSRSVLLNVTQIRNGKAGNLTSQKAEKETTRALSQTPGFESLIFTPEFTNAAGRKRFGMPVKFSFAVTPKKEAINDWFGICTHYSHGWDLQTLEFLPPAGIGFLRDEMGWSTCEKEKGSYVFPESWDAYVNRAIELGVKPLVILDYANPNYDGGDFPHTEEGIAGFAGYCRAIAEHFRGRVQHFEIWNEWTGGCGMSSFCKNGFNTPENYVRLIARASEALRAVDPEIVIIGGGGDHHTAHFKQIEAMMKLGVMNYCDAFSVHPYVYPQTPEKANVREDLQKVIDCMKANGCKKPRLWLTELGWPTHQGGNAPGFASNNSFECEDLEAQMTARASIVYRSLPEVEKFFWYDLKNDGTDLAYNENNFGIIHHDSVQFQPKAAYAAVAVVSQVLNGAESVRKSELSTEKLAVYEIRRSDAPAVLAAWSLTGEPQKIVLPASGTVSGVQGLYGQPLPDSERMVGEQPVYFFSEKLD